MLNKILIMLNIIILILSLSFLIMGGIFYCSTSYAGKLYGNISCAGAFIFMIIIYIIIIPSKNNGRFPLSELSIMIPVIITILSVLLTSYNTKKYRKDIISNKANQNYYLYNSMYVVSLGVIIILQIFNLIMNYYYNLTNPGIQNIGKYILLFTTAINAVFSYLCHHYLNL